MFKKNKNENNQNPYTIKVTNCEGNRYVISDIHGCNKTFRVLVDKIKLTEKDQLFLLGDYIDRGADSLGVVYSILELQEKFQVFPLRGNHEEDLLLIEKIGSPSMINNYIIKNGGSTLYNGENEIEEKHLNFLNSLPFFIELENDFLVHAGFDFKDERPFWNADEMLWIRDFIYDEEVAKGKRIIHGHTPYKLYQIKRKLKYKDKILPLDNGCIFNGSEGLGNLLCLNLTKNELIIQENIES